MLKLNVEAYCNKVANCLTVLHAPSCHSLSGETFSWGLTIDHLVLADSQGHAKNIKAFLLLNNSNKRYQKKRRHICFQCTCSNTHFCANLCKLKV